MGSVNWIEAYIEFMSLPVTEVLAINKDGDFLVGHLNIQGATIFCEDQHQVLPDVTHFIETKNIPLP